MLPDFWHRNGRLTTIFTSFYGLFLPPLLTQPLNFVVVVVLVIIKKEWDTVTTKMAKKLAQMTCILWNELHFVFHGRYKKLNENFIIDKGIFIFCIWENETTDKWLIMVFKVLILFSIKYRVTISNNQQIIYKTYFYICLLPTQILLVINKAVYFYHSEILNSPR